MCTHVYEKTHQIFERNEPILGSWPWVILVCNQRCAMYVNYTGT